MEKLNKILIQWVLTALITVPVTICHADSELELDELVELMTGSFSSQSQSQADEDFFDIRLEMVRIWQHVDAQTTGVKGGTRTLYVEQAAASALDKPYRQRVYHVIQHGDQLISRVYTLPNPERYIGGWKSPKSLDDFYDDEELILRDGCDVYLKRIHARHYRGSTRGKGCKSTLRGASYATSHVNITPKGIESWDQGFDADDQQVWGAVKGPYIFDRQ